MASETQAPSAAQWPDASLWPNDDAPPIEWARFYRDAMGWVVLPTAAPIDVISYARKLACTAAAEHATQYGEEPDEETSAAFWDDAREIAESTLGRPIGYIYKAWTERVSVAADVTDAMLRQAWLSDEHSTGVTSEAHTRGICILPNRSARGLPVCLVDADVGHDDSPAADLQGEWGWGLAGPKASTPRGGLHTLMLATGREVTSQGHLAPGVDVVAVGNTPIPVPSGSATPGRRWLRRDPPVVAPDALCKRGRKKTPPRLGAVAASADRQPGDDEGEWDEGRGAQIVRSECGDGERNDLCKVLVGILARPRACPPDFVAAALELLAEEMVGRDRPSAEVREEAARWQHLLTRGPRDADFAGEFLATWLRVRDTSRTPMKTKPRKFAASVWKVCDRREEGGAGAEDFGVGPRLGVAGEAMGAAPVTVAVEAVPPTPPTDHPAEPIPYPPPPTEVAAAAVAASGVDASRWRGGVDPRNYALSLGEDYTREDLQRDLERKPIRIDAVMPALDFASGVHSTSPDLLTPPVRFGWGAGLNTAMRGLSPGSFVAVGASSAGAGKTTFLDWLVNGLGLQTACRLRGVPGYEQAPVCLVVKVSEMPKRNELYSRLAASYLGFDRACLDLGTAAHEDASVALAASRLSMLPEEYVAKARALEDEHGNNERCPLYLARNHVIRRVKLSNLPRHSRRGGVAVHHRSGPDLVDHLADAVDFFREELAYRAGVPAADVLPVVVIDPAQRFAGGGESQRDAIDAVLGAANELLCTELGCVVFTTNDTTKAAARGVSLDHFLSAEGPGLMADVLAGSQGIMHHASDVIIVHPERPTLPGEERPGEDPSKRPRPGCRRQWVRLPRSRGGGEAPLAFPFDWEGGTGRLHPREPEPLRPPPERDGERRSFSAGGTERSAPKADPLAGFPEIGTVLVDTPFNNDFIRGQVKAAGGQWDRHAKAWACEASRVRDVVRDEGLTWRTPANRAVKVDSAPAPSPSFGSALPRPANLPSTPWDD